MYKGLISDILTPHLMNMTILICMDYSQKLRLLKILKEKMLPKIVIPQKTNFIFHKELLQTGTPFATTALNIQQILKRIINSLGNILKFTDILSL